MTDVKTLAKDLTKEAPRSPRERIHGYSVIARMIDKCRADIAGTKGEFHFDCPVDNMLFGFKGLKGADVREFIATGASDEEIATYVDTHGEPKTAEEIKAWADGTDAYTTHGDPEKGAWFDGECARLGLDPAKATLWDMLEADDKTIGKTA